jgi:putative effector of murein hydrolase
MFEHRHQPLVSQKKFMLRILGCVLVAAALFVVTILIGATSYHCLEQLFWTDSILNAVLVMTGIGLTVTLQTTVAKILTSFYAILSAIVFFSILAILISPLFHRFLHKFHLDLEGKNR